MTYPSSSNALQAEALFASALQRSDELSIGQIRRAVTVALDAYGDAGCAGRVAQEFGDHPETAAARMRWARAAVAGFGALRNQARGRKEASGHGR